MTNCQLSEKVAFVYSFIELPGSPVIISSSTDIQATSLTVKWTAPADDGGSPIAAYRVVILKGSTEIKNVNITDPGITRLSVGDLERNTEYNVKVFARNVVFEGAAVQKTITTKMKGKMSRRQLSLSSRNQTIILLPCDSLLGLLYRRE